MYTGLSSTKYFVFIVFCMFPNYYNDQTLLLSVHFPCVHELTCIHERVFVNESPVCNFVPWLE